MDDRIDKTIDRTDSVTLTCRNHRHLRWWTKNIGHIGARSIHFRGDASRPGYHPAPFWGDYLRHLEEGNLTNPDTGERITTRDELEFRFLQEGLVVECDCPLRDLEVLQ